MHIGEVIKKELERQEKTITWFAEQLSCQCADVCHILEKSSIDTGLLLNISQILNYDFFEDLTKEFEREAGIDRKSACLL